MNSPGKNRPSMRKSGWQVKKKNKNPTNQKNSMSRSGAVFCNLDHEHRSALGTSVGFVQTGSALRLSPGPQLAPVGFLKRDQAPGHVSGFLLLSNESHGFELGHERLFFGRLLIKTC